MTVSTSSPSPVYSAVPVQWQTSPGLVDYPSAVAAMEARVQAISAGVAREWVWLLQHPPLYTAGTSAKADDLLDGHKFPVFQSGRGGQYTYHGPGQRVAYVMLDLKTRGRDVKCFVHGLEGLIIDTLADFDIAAERRPGRVGVWMETHDASGRPVERKIAAIGVRIKRWVSFHGLAINLNPDLSHFDGIVPCGIREHGVTSLHDLGKTISADALDARLCAHFQTRFGPVTMTD